MLGQQKLRREVVRDQASENWHRIGFAYDRDNRLVKVWDGSEAARYDYDCLGNLTKEEQVIEEGFRRQIRYSQQKNKYNRQIRFTPERLLITNNAGSFIKISDDHGIWIERDKDIHIRDKGQMAVVSEEQDVTLLAENVLRLRQKETSIKLSEDIILSGGEFRLQQ